MKPPLAYDIWSQQYDTNLNKTRDLEGAALQEMLQPFTFKNSLEVGCGTGKNTAWLASVSNQVIAVDLSAEMLALARQKVTAENVQFLQVNILEDWNFTKLTFDLITFSLVLEHIPNLDHIFYQCKKLIAFAGIIYIGELHPFKQYSGTKANFNNGSVNIQVECFNHHISDFTNSARIHGFMLKDFNEYFDNNDRNSIPRIATFLFQNID